MGDGPVLVNMMGCDAVDSTYALSDWVLRDTSRADEALAFLASSGVLTKLKAVDGKNSKWSPFIPDGTGAVALDTGHG